MCKSPKPRTATCKSGLQVRQEGGREVRRTIAKKGRRDAS